MSEGFDDTLARAQARVGLTLKDKWTLDRLVGVGGMASVYAATHRNRKRVAVKMLHTELSLNVSVRQRFLREGYVANSVDHRGAVAVDDDDVTEDGCAFLVMELLDGETLDARWERKGKRLPTEEVLSLMDQVLDTLVAAHAKGIVHRDLKPENLFLTREGAVKVLDFGIARVRELSQSTTKTQTGSMMGTPAFMPPEQARGRWEDVDGQSDLWAIGATMFTLLTGRYVHEAGTVNEALVLAVTARARSVGELRADLPRSVIDLVDRALAYEKSDRFADAATLQSALRRTYRALEAAEWNDAPGSPSDTVAAPPVGRAESAPAGSVGSDIPPEPPPVAKPGALTTSRGVERAAHDDREEPKRDHRRVVALAAAGALGVGIVVIGIGLSVRSPEPGAERAAAGASPNQQVRAAPTPEAARLQVAPATSAEATDAVSLHDLPIARLSAQRPSPPPPQVRVELEQDPTPSNPYSAASTRAPKPAPSAPSTVGAPVDPFAARQ